MAGSFNNKKKIPSGPNIASLPRAISKLGICSRSKGEELIKTGRVKVNGKIVTSPLQRVNILTDKISVAGESPSPKERIYLMLNKPKGLITTATDEKGRDTVFSCFKEKELPYIFPVGRLDKASEGLLLFTNDTDWGNRITMPSGKIEKTYHVQINSSLTAENLSRISNGITDNGEMLKVKKIKLVRSGEKNRWFEIVLDEGKNRHIRRIFESLNIKVVRLIRIGIGPLRLDNLPKGEFRILTKEEASFF